MSYTKQIFSKPLYSNREQSYRKKNSYDIYKNTLKFFGLQKASELNNLKLIKKNEILKQEYKQFKKLTEYNHPKYNNLFTETDKKNFTHHKIRNESEILGNNVKLKLTKKINNEITSNNNSYHSRENNNTNYNYFNHRNSSKQKINQNNSQQKINFLNNDNNKQVNFLDKSNKIKSEVYNLSNNSYMNKLNKNINNNEDPSKVRLKINYQNINFNDLHENKEKYPKTPQNMGKIILMAENTGNNKLEIKKKNNMNFINSPENVFTNRNTVFFKNKINKNTKEDSSYKDGFTISTVNETKIKKGRISIDSEESNICNQNIDKKNICQNNIPEEMHFFYVNLIQKGRSIEFKGLQGE